MSFGQWLIHSCTVQRATMTTDAYRVSKPVWASVASGLRCRLVATAQRRTPDDLSQSPVIASFKLLVPTGTDVQIGDQITSIALEDGTTDAGPYRIEAVLTRRAASARHISLQLTRAI